MRRISLWMLSHRWYRCRVAHQWISRAMDHVYSYERGLLDGFWVTSPLVLDFAGRDALDRFLSDVVGLNRDTVSSLGFSFKRVRRQPDWLWWPLGDNTYRGIRKRVLEALDSSLDNRLDNW